MRSNLFLLSCLLVLCFTSCQKSIEWNDLILTPPTTPTTPTTPGGGTTTGALLDKIVSLSTTDTVTQTFFYDASNRLIKQTNVGISLGDKVDESLIFTRDASGKLIQYTKIAYSTSSSGYDTSYITVHYPSGSSNFDYAIAQSYTSGFYLKDSTSYSYSANKIAGYKLYYSNILTGGLSILALGVDYVYDASGNITSGNINSYNGSTTPTLESDFVLTYDNKKSPLILGNEAIITLGENYLGSNNALSFTTTDRSGTSAGDVVKISYTYSYNSNNLPTQASGIASLTGQPAQTSQLTYFYK